MSRDLKTAAVALVGALIGGLLSASGVVYAEHLNTQRAEKRHQEAGRGAARLLVDEFRAAGLYFERTVQSKVTGPPVPPDTRVVVSDSDRRLMSANMSPDAYGRASETRIVVNYVLSRISARNRGRPFNAPLRPTDESLMRLALKDLAEGREALRPLSGEGPVLEPAPPLRRPQPSLDYKQLVPSAP